jgi:hypothetical protein
MTDLLATLSNFGERIGPYLRWLLRTPTLFSGKSGWYPPFNVYAPTIKANYSKDGFSSYAFRLA